LLGLATPAWAERTLFDHQLVSRIGEVLDSGREEMILYGDSNPA
jgi:hypothetical protein